MVLRLKIDCNSDTKVRLNLPIPLVRVLLESSVSLDGLTNETVAKNIDLNKVMELVGSGVVGTLLEVDGEDYHVEIVVE